MVTICDNEIEQGILNILLKYDFITHDWPDIDKKFAISALVGTVDSMKYVEENWPHITESKIQDIFIILARQCSAESPGFIFLNALWSLDTKYTNKYGNNCLLVACFENENLSMVKYLIEEKMFDPHHRDRRGYNCLMNALANSNPEIFNYLIELCDLDNLDLSCRSKDDRNMLSTICKYNKNPNTAKYLISHLKMISNIDENHTDAHGHNCLMAACMYNNIDVINFLITGLKMDPGQKDRNGNNCLMLACQQNNNIDVVKFLASKLLHNDTNMHRNNCLMIAASVENINPEIIKFLVNDLKIDVNIKNKYGDTCSIIACQNNQNLEIIKLLMNRHDNQSTPDLIESNNKCLRTACMCNKNVDVVKYLIESIGCDPNYLDHNRDNCLTAGCWTNDCLEVIKYLINDLKMDLKHTDKLGNNCFMAACMYEGCNLDVIKFLVTETQVDVNQVTIGRQRSGLHHVTNSQVLDYLINNPKISISLPGMEAEKIEYIILNINDYDKVNSLIKKGDVLWTVAMSEIVKKINPFILTEFNKKIYKINPFVDKTYSECQDLIDKLHDKVSSPALPYIKRSHVIGKNVFNDFTTTPELLFRQGDIEYWGHREIVYNTMHLFKDIGENLNFGTNIILDGNLPKDVMNQYIVSSYTGSIDLNLIPCDHFINFLKFIHQYPTDHLTIDKLEAQIIKYIDKNKIKYCDYLKGICNKYQLKSMYLDMHNKKFD